jgi:hypothetical protein
VLIEVSPGGGAAAGVVGLAPEAAVFAGLGSASGATPLVGGDCATCDVAAGPGGASGDDGLAAVAAGATTSGNVGNGAAGVVAGVCAAVLARSAAWAGGRVYTESGVLVWAEAERANAISDRNAASIANVLKRNGKALFHAVTTRRPPWLHQSSVFMFHPPKAPTTRCCGLRTCPTNGVVQPGSATVCRNVTPGAMHWDKV